MVARLSVVVIAVALFVSAYLIVRGDRQPTRRFLSGAERTRQTLFQQIQPVRLKNCVLERFGEANDGGYLLCGNLLGSVQAGYSYGISGYDGWGCDVSRRFGVALHQYDCFDLREPICGGGKMVFHAECVASERKVEDGRIFDTLQQQILQNGDDGKQLVVKMDVERAEWDSLLATPSDVLDRFAQLVIEFHGTDEVRFIVALQKLKELFFVAHVHFNNYSCVDNAAPFPAEAYEVLFVNKRLGQVDTSAPAPGRHPFEAPNNPGRPDCQARLIHLPAGTLRNASPVSVALARK
jgi:hypothetical protein